MTAFLASMLHQILVTQSTIRQREAFHTDTAVGASLRLAYAINNVGVECIKVLIRST